VPAEKWLSRLRLRAEPPPWNKPDPALVSDMLARAAPPQAPAPEPEYTTEEIAEMWGLYKAHRCVFCGGAHQRECPRVKMITRYADGKPQSVTYFRKWDDSNVLWPEDIPGEPPKEQP
jgi:hypothetical protein